MRYTALTQKLDTIWSDGLYGDSKWEYFEMTWGNDAAYGGGGNDVFWDVDGSTGAGNQIWLSSDDRIYGDDGDDLVFAGLGADAIYGGAGHDTLDYRYSNASVILDITAGRGNGTSASASTGDRFTGIERFNGSTHDDTFVLSDGQAAENVTVDGGAGRDTFFGGAWRVELFGGAGNDIFRETSFSTDAHGGAGDDLFVTPASGSDVYGGDGFDTLTLALATSSVRLEFSDHDGMERIVGTGYGDLIETGTADGERMTVEGGVGSDILKGSLGHESLYGGAGHDVMDSRWGDDFLFGGDGHDDMRGGSGNDWMRGGTGNDQMIGETGRDTMWGDDGDDRMSTGDSGLMMGGAGNDALLMGGTGVTAYGGTGADSFVFIGPAFQGRIADFQQGSDGINVNTHVGGIWSRDTLRADGPNALDVLVDGKEAGHINWMHKLGDTLIQIDRDMDGASDYSILLTGTFTMSAADFIL
jgi:Ca2+-binding RTX toxin-like protein